MAEGERGDADRGFRSEANHAVAIRRDHLCVDAVREQCGPIADRRAVDADWERTTSAERIQRGALSFDSEASWRVVERSDRAPDEIVALGFSEDGVAGRAGFECERALAWRRAELVDSEAL